MKEENHEIIASFEKTNWWYRAKRDLLRTMLRARKRRYNSILDLGCGVGSNINVLREFSDNVTGVDYSAQALAFCKDKGYSSLLQMDAANLTKLKDKSFDLVVCSDVLEHIDDVAATGEIARVLRPGGLLLFSVPAHMYLWGPTDVMSQHLRRYEPPGLRTLFARSFTIEKLSYWNFVMYVPNVVFIKLLNLQKKKMKPTNTLSLIPSVLNNLIYSLLWIENRTLMKIKNIQGVSIVGLCRKR